MAVGRALAWIETNLWAILCAIVTAGSGVLIGMTTASHRLDVLESKVARIEGVQGQRTNFNVCVVRSVDKLNSKLGVEPACNLEVPE